MKESSKQMHLIMFDIDGTLVESSYVEDQLFINAVRSVISGKIDENWGAYKNVTLTGIVEEICTRMTVEHPAEIIVAQVRQAYADSVRNQLASKPSSIREIPGAASFLGELMQRTDVRVAVATGGWRETASMKLSHIGIDPATLNIATSEDANQRTTIMDIARSRASADIEFSSQTYFGDGHWDKHACDEAGFDFIAIGDQVEHEFRYSDYTDHAAILNTIGL